MTFLRIDYDSMADFLATTLDTRCLPGLLKAIVDERKQITDEVIAKQQADDHWPADEIQRFNDARIENHSKVSKTDMESLAEKLCQYGIRDVGTYEANNWAYGSYAVVIPITEKKQLLRISIRKDEDRPYNIPPPMMLRPIEEFDAGKFHISILPEVETGHMYVKPEHIRFLHDMAAACGYLFWDIREENVGLLKNGMPVILDAGAACDIEHLRMPLKIHQPVIERVNLSDWKRDAFTLDAYIRQKEVTLKNVTKHNPLHETLLANLTRNDNDADTQINSAFEEFNSWLAIMKAAKWSMNKDNPLDKAIESALAKYTEHGEGFKRYLDMQPDMRALLGKLYDAHQHYHMHELKLTYGKTSGVFDEKALQRYFERYNDNTPRKSKLADLVRGYGLCRESLGRASLEAAAEYVQLGPLDDTKWIDLVAAKSTRIIEPD